MLRHGRRLGFSLRTTLESLWKCCVPCPEHGTEPEVEGTTLLWEEPFSLGVWNPGVCIFQGFFGQNCTFKRIQRYTDVWFLLWLLSEALLCAMCVCSYITKASLMCLQLLTPNRNHLPKGFPRENAAKPTLCPSFIVPTCVLPPPAHYQAQDVKPNWGNAATLTRDFQKNMVFVLLHFAGWLVMSNSGSQSWFGGSGAAAPRWAQPHWESPILGMHFPKSLTLPAQSQLHLECHHRVTTHPKGRKISIGFTEVSF